ncbi:cold shock domain-containing protein [Kitasatospora sp. NPDC097643]|uniref:cold-shock protein n=1 Tax=Kitasatospora sp. NPDC097643 TaxID=3157230 RepID=UPI00332AD501
MATGKVIRFDDIRGYGFIAIGGGDDDVFLHANDLLVEKHLIKPGITVEFDLEDGDRGPKASAVTIVEHAPAPAGEPVDVDDLMCEVLTMKELTDEITEALLHVTPSLTGEQILNIRRSMAKLAANHGWVES